MDCCIISEKNEMRWPRSHRTTIYAVQILVIQFRKLKKTLTLCFIDALKEWKKLLLTAKKPVWTFVDRKQPRRTIFPIICDASAKTGYQNGNSRFQAHFLVTGIGDSGRKNVMSMRELFSPNPLAGFEKMAGLQIFYYLKIKCFHS